MKPSRPKNGGLWFEREMYQHPAFLSLSKNAVKALFALLDGRNMKNVSPKGKKKKFECMNPDNLRLPYGLLEKTYLIPRGRIPAAIDELMEKGFMERKQVGGSKKHDMAIYALSGKWRLWIPGAKPFQVREARQHHGYQGRPLGAVANRLKAENANIALKLGKPFLNTDFVFASRRGEIMRRIALENALTRCLSAAKLRHIRIHDLRHSYSTIRLLKGHNIGDVSYQLGHSSISMTYDVYSHWIPGHFKSEVDELDSLRQNSSNYDSTIQSGN